MASSPAESKAVFLRVFCSPFAFLLLWAWWLGVPVGPEMIWFPFTYLQGCRLLLFIAPPPPPWGWLAASASDPLIWAVGELRARGF